MTKSCVNCQRNVENINVAGDTFFRIKVIDSNGNVLKEIYCCTPCWHHQKQDKKYLDKPYNIIWKITKSNVSTENTEIQNLWSFTNVIDLYRQIESNYNGKIDLEELQEIVGFQSSHERDIPLDSEEKTKLSQLETKYKLNNSSSNPSQIRSNTFSNNIPKGARPNPSNNSNSSPILIKTPNKFNWKQPWVIATISVSALAIIGLIFYLVSRNKSKE